MPSVPVIADRGEFIDVLKLMRKGRLLVRSEQDRCLIDGFEVVHSFETLSTYGLLEELPPAADAEVHAPHLHWYRLSPRGREFAARAWVEWKARPLWQRLLFRICG